MTELKGKVIIVTGASSGIGKSVAEALVAAGSTVVGCGRNLGRLQDVAKSVNAKESGKMIAIKCDVSVENEIIAMFNFVEEEYKTLHAVVNNAGVAENDSLLSGKTSGWMKMLQVNVMGVAICAREAVKLMKKFGVDNGHVVNINSVYGRIVPNAPILHFITATKHAVTALTEGLRQELRAEKSHIRVSAISPGLTNTEIVARAIPNDPELLKSILPSFEISQPEDIAQAVVYVLEAPSRLDVNEVIIRSYEEIV